MLDYLLLFIALITWFFKRSRYLSILLYLGFMFEGYHLFNGLAFYSLKNLDLAVIYTFVISLSLILTHQYKLPEIKFKKWYYAFVAFIFFCALYSRYHYYLSWLEILQGGRFLLLIFSLPIMFCLSHRDTNRILRGLYWITMFTGGIYILQVLIQHPIFLQHSAPEPDHSTGLLRFYDYPVFLTFFLVHSFICPSFFGKRLLASRVLFIFCVLASLGRTFILVNFVGIILTLSLQGRFERLLRTFVVLFLLLLPFYGMVRDRFEEGNTSGDLASIINGDFQTDTSFAGATMTYRFAWVYERFDYLMQGTFGEKMFGLGLLSDDSPTSKQLYNFKIRIVFPNITMQLRTPDIAYGTMIAYMGIGGMILYLILYGSLICFFFKRKDENPFFFLGFVMLCASLLIGFAGDSISNPQYLSPYFLLLSFYKLDTYGRKAINNNCNRNL